MTKSDERKLGDLKRDKIIKRDEGKCQVCGSKEFLEVHHILALVYGGTSDDENLITLCKVCHRMAPETGIEEFKLYKSNPGLSVYHRMMSKKHIKDKIQLAFLDLINERLEKYIEQGFMNHETKMKILFFETKEINKEF